MTLTSILMTFTVVLRVTVALDNGLALTPPMGWLTWQRFRCNTDCKNQPDTCISENLIKTMAILIVKDGYAALGYQYIIMDDCWLAPNRTADGSLQPDPDRFPSGVKALTDYVHQLGPKFGIYENFCTKTCAGFPGSEFYLQQDAKTFADWGVDYVKFDGCYSDRHDFDEGYKAFGFFLNQTGRPMVYSCEWPFYQSEDGITPDNPAIQRTCNLWRNYYDVQDTWDSVSSTIQYYAKDKYNLASYAKPGGWNDADQLMIGNFGLSYEQSRVQMAMWSMMASPLLIATDLRTITADMKSLIQNKYMIDINQDPLGIQGKMIGTIKDTKIDVWVKPLSGFKGTCAVALLQIPNLGNPTLISIKARDVGLTATNGYSLTDAFSGQLFATTSGPDTVLKFLVNPNGVVMFVAKPA